LVENDTMRKGQGRLPQHLNALASLIAPHTHDPTLGNLYQELTALSEDYATNRRVNLVSFKPGKIGPSAEVIFAPEAHAMRRSFAQYITIESSDASDSPGELVKCKTPGCKGWRPK
jgi:hypothetical protein